MLMLNLAWLHDRIHLIAETSHAPESFQSTYMKKLVCSVVGMLCCMLFIVLHAVYSCWYIHNGALCSNTFFFVSAELLLLKVLAVTSSYTMPANIERWSRAELLSQVSNTLNSSSHKLEETHSSDSVFCYSCGGVSFCTHYQLITVMLLLMFKMILFKGLLHPKTKMLSFLTCPRVVSKPAKASFFFVNTI